MFDLDRYLARLGFDSRPDSNVDILDALIYAHQCNVPFENLDICELGKSVSLDVDDVFDKVVARHRGGYCFELNGLFCELLRALGFDAWSCFVRVFVDGIGFKAISHRGIIVDIEGALHYVDVGLGGAMPPFSVPIDGTRKTQRKETYWVEDGDDGWHVLKRVRGRGILDSFEASQEIVDVVMFSLLPVRNEDFLAYSHWVSMTPGAFFASRRLVNLRTSEGYRSIVDDECIEVSDSGRESIEISAANLAMVLREKFGIDWD